MSALRETCCALGGGIELASERGHGTTVRCRVPLWPASARQRPAKLSSIVR